MSTSIAGRNSERENISETAAPHPEEMKATIDLNIGKAFTIKAMVRATPAGLVSVALLIAAILIPRIWITRTRARERV